METTALMKPGGWLKPEMRERVPPADSGAGLALVHLLGVEVHIPP